MKLRVIGEFYFHERYALISGIGFAFNHGGTLLHDNGGELIVAPNLNADVAAMSKNCGMIYCPGILTPTEAFNALALGADALKIFPADAHPPSYIKSTISLTSCKVSK